MTKRRRKQQMNIDFGCQNINDFLSQFPRKYIDSLQRKLGLLKKHGINGCLDTDFFHRVSPSELPEDYVLELVNPDIPTQKTVYIFFQWDSQYSVLRFIRVHLKE